MKVIYSIAGIVIFIKIFWFAPLISSAGELVLFKEAITDEGSPDPLGDCSGLFYVKQGENVLDMSGFHDYYCDGIYSITLEGSLNTTVTLFGNFYHKTDRGYLILRKTDDRKVWVIHPGSFRSGSWLHVEPDDKRYGSYDIYYHQGLNFEHDISSVKWGKWWVGAVPSSETR